jgi:hypothetical protein
MTVADLAEAIGDALAHSPLEKTLPCPDIPTAI